MGKFSGDAPEVKKDEGPSISRLLNFIAGSMTPLLPGMLGCGMVKVLLTLLTTFAGLSAESSSYIMLNALGDCFFMFLPVLLCYTTAKKMNGTPIMWMIIGCMLVYPDLVSLMGGASLELGSFLGMPSTSLFGIPVITATYTSSVLPVLLMAPVMKWVNGASNGFSSSRNKLRRLPSFF